MGKRMITKKQCGLAARSRGLIDGSVSGLCIALLMTAGMTAGTSAAFAQNRAFVEIEKQRNFPIRGQSQAKVRGTYGEPSSTTPAVGQPPISRWNYPGFTVYFEYSHVITTVAEQDSLPVKLGDIQ